MNNNVVYLLGRVGKDPEVKSYDFGKIASFSLATDESYKKKDGTKVEKTEWHNVTCKIGLAEFAEKYIRKGNRVALWGSIASREYEKDGEKKRFYEIVANAVTPIDWPDRDKAEHAEPESESDGLPF